MIRNQVKDLNTNLSTNIWFSKVLISLGIFALMLFTSAQAQNNNFAKVQLVNTGQVQLNNSLVGYTPDCYNHPDLCNPIPIDFCRINPWACPPQVDPPIRWPWPPVCLSCPPDIFLDKDVLINKGLVDVVKQHELIQVNPAVQGIHQQGMHQQGIIGQGIQVQQQMLPGDQFRQFR